jgi:hypothetical protein
MVITQHVFGIEHQTHNLLDCIDVADFCLTFNTLSDLFTNAPVVKVRYHNLRLLTMKRG